MLLEDSRLTRLRRTADMGFHEFLVQRITGMILDARRQGQASRINTGGRASSSGLAQLMVNQQRVRVHVSGLITGAPTTKASQASLA